PDPAGGLEPGPVSRGPGGPHERGPVCAERLHHGHRPLRAGSDEAVDRERPVGRPAPPGDGGWSRPRGPGRADPASTRHDVRWADGGRLAGRARGAGVSIRVLIADDQPVVRDGLAMLLGLIDDVEVVGTAADGIAAVELACSERPDVVLMDLRMPRLEGAEATRQILASQPETRVLILTTYADDESLFPA